MSVAHTRSKVDERSESSRQVYSKSAPQQSQWEIHHVERAIRSVLLLASCLHEPRTPQACLISLFLVGNELQITLDLILLRKPKNQWSSEQNGNFSAIPPPKEEWWLLDMKSYDLSESCRGQLCQTANPVSASVQCLNPAWSSPRMLFIKA